MAGDIGVIPISHRPAAGDRVFAGTAVKRNQRLCLSLSIYGGQMIITFEGVDKTGKTTQAAFLSAALKARGLKVWDMHFPTIGPTMSGIKGILQTGDRDDKSQMMTLCKLFAKNFTGRPRHSRPTGRRPHSDSRPLHLLQLGIRLGLRLGPGTGYSCLRMTCALLTS